MQQKIKILVVFGTRPEAIKMSPLVLEFKKNNLFDVKLCVTAQHRHMLDQVLDFFEIEPNYDLDLMLPNQTLFELSANILLGLKKVFEDFNPDFTFVHGDTTTSMVTALAAFYSRTRVCHIEAGLRTHKKYSPYPEEINRQLTARLADYHFAPTQNAKDNLIKENINESQIEVTGNTVIDALFIAKEKVEHLNEREVESLKGIIDPNRKLILVTGHRRENFGEGFKNICLALAEIAKNNSVQIIYPVHLNPNVQKPVNELLSNNPNISLISPLSYPAFVWLMKRAHLILTDSGGIQEEAPSLGKPVLVMRENTERPEVLFSKRVKLVGTDPAMIVKHAKMLLEEDTSGTEVSINPFGDGTACRKIVSFIAAKYS